MTLGLKRATAILALGCLTSCAPEGRDAGFTVKDSAGIRISESSLPAWSEQQRWSIGPAPELRIGAADGSPEQILFRVSAARRLPGGDLLVATSGPELRRYDASGAFLRTLGVAGEGPGDYQTIASIDPRSGDSIGIFDHGLVRYTMLAPDGRFARSVTLYGVRSRGVGPVGPSSDGGYLAFILSSGPRERATGLRRDAHPFVRIDLAGGPPDTIGRFTGQDQFEVADGSGMLTGPVPFYRSRAQAVRGSDLLIALTETFEIKAYDRAGEVSEIIRRAFEPAPVTQEQVDVWKERQLRFITDSPSRAPGGNERRRTLIESMVFHPTHPVLRWLEVDAVGNVWVHHALPPDVAGDPVTSPVWSVFDPEGRWLGEVKMPDRFRPTDIGSDYVLGVTTDELGVEYLELYPLQKP